MNIAEWVKELKFFIHIEKKIAIKADRCHKFTKYWQKRLHIFENNKDFHCKEVSKLVFAAIHRSGMPIFKGQRQSSLDPNEMSMIVMSGQGLH